MMPSCVAGRYGLKGQARPRHGRGVREDAANGVGSISWNILTWGAVMKNDPKSRETSVTPAWRSAFAHVAWTNYPRLQVQYRPNGSALCALLWRAHASCLRAAFHCRRSRRSMTRTGCSSVTTASSQPASVPTSTASMLSLQS